MRGNGGAFPSLACSQAICPFVPSLELQSESDVIHAQIAIDITHNGIRNNSGDLLRNDTDVELIAPPVAGSIESYSVVTADQLDNVPLEANIRIAQREASCSGIAHPVQLWRDREIREVRREL